MSKAVKSVFGGGGGAAHGGQSIRSATLKTKKQEDISKRQEGFLDRLQDRAEGKAPSLAEAQMKAAQDRSLKQQLATAQSGRGGNAAASQRNLARSQAQAGAQIAQQSGQAKLQEQQQAEANVLDELSRQRSQDLAMEQARANAAIGVGSALNQQQSQQRQMQSQRIGQFGNILGSFLGSDKNIKKDIKKMSSSGDQKVDKKKIGTDSGSGEGSKKGGGAAGKATKAFASMQKEGEAGGEKARAEQASTVSTSASKLGSGASQADSEAKSIKLGSSDINNKKDIKQFIDKLQAYTYKYKEPNKPHTRKGTQTGIMAQDLEKSKIGREMVLDTPEGKIVDYARGYGAILAAQDLLNKRIEKIEKRKSKK